MEKVKDEEEATVVKRPSDFCLKGESDDVSEAMKKMMSIMIYT
jgi:hypothetical protein